MLHNAREITVLLDQNNRDETTDEVLFRLVKARFQAIATSLLRRERPEMSLQATMLVDDAFLKLVRLRDQQWSSREAFFAQAARTMRRLIIDHARERRAEKRGGGQRPVPLDDANSPCQWGSNPEALITLDEILQRLEDQYPEVFQVFNLHYFMRYELKEIAEDILETSYTTVRRRWQMARAFLRRELIGDE